MFSMLTSFFGGKLQLGIAGFLIVCVVTISVLYGVEKIKHSNTKVKLTNSISEVSALKVSVNLLTKDQEAKGAVINGLRSQVSSCLTDFEEYRKNVGNILAICTEAKEVKVEDSTLEVLDEESNKKYIDAINNVLSIN